jgi:hypothetical protein
MGGGGAVNCQVLVAGAEQRSHTSVHLITYLNTTHIPHRVNGAPRHRITSTASTHNTPSTQRTHGPLWACLHDASNHTAACVGAGMWRVHADAASCCAGVPHSWERGAAHLRACMLRGRLWRLSAVLLVKALHKAQLRVESQQSTGSSQRIVCTLEGRDNNAQSHASQHNQASFQLVAHAADAGGGRCGMLTRLVVVEPVADAGDSIQSRNIC